MPMTLEQLANRINARLHGTAGVLVHGCAGLEQATGEEVSFLANRKYFAQVKTSRACAVIVSEDLADQFSDRTLLIAKDPYFAFREAVVALHGFREHPEAGISDRAFVDPTATIGEGTTVQPFVCIARGATVGRNCVIYPNCYVGESAVIGDNCLLYPNVTVYDHCVLGNRVTLHAGCVIGQDGFGYATHQGKHHKIPQIGNVLIEDDVEMGAGCTIDRATVGSTVIGEGSKFSDLIAIGHGSVVGKHNLLVAQVGLAGSVKTGNYVVFGGQVGVAGHLYIGDGAQIAAKAGVMNDLPGGETYGGQPALPFNEAKRSIIALMTLPKLQKEFKQLKKRMAELEAQLSEQAAKPK